MPISPFPFFPHYPMLELWAAAWHGYLNCQRKDLAAQETLSSHCIPVSASATGSHAGHRAKNKSVVFKSESKMCFFSHPAGLSSHSKNNRFVLGFFSSAYFNPHVDSYGVVVALLLTQSILSEASVHWNPQFYSRNNPSPNSSPSLMLINNNSREKKKSLNKMERGFNNNHSSLFKTALQKCCLYHRSQLDNMRNVRNLISRDQSLGRNLWEVFRAYSMIRSWKQFYKSQLTQPSKQLLCSSRPMARDVHLFGFVLLHESLFQNPSALWVS